MAFERILASGWVFEACDKVSLLEEVWKLMAPDDSLEDFIHAVVADKQQRIRWGDVLKPRAHALDFPDFMQLFP